MVPPHPRKVCILDLGDSVPPKSNNTVYVESVHSFIHSGYIMNFVSTSGTVVTLRCGSKSTVGDGKGAFQAQPVITRLLLNALFDDIENES